MNAIQIRYHIIGVQLQNDTEDLENRVLILELEMDNVQDDVLILYDDVIELRNQDSLTDLRLVTVEEDVEGTKYSCVSNKYTFNSKTKYVHF